MARTAMKRLKINTLINSSYCPRMFVYIKAKGEKEFMGKL